MILGGIALSTIYLLTQFPQVQFPLHSFVLWARKCGIVCLAHGRSLRHFLDKVSWWHFQSTSKEVIWPKKFLNYMHGLKSAILAIFLKGLGWPCPVSAALKNAS